MHQSFEPLVVSDPQKIVGIYRWPIFKTLLISLPLFSFLLGLIILLSSFERENEINNTCANFCEKTNSSIMGNMKVADKRVSDYFRSK